MDYAFKNEGDLKYFKLFLKNEINKNIEKFEKGANDNNFIANLLLSLSTIDDQNYPIQKKYYYAKRLFFHKDWFFGAMITLLLENNDYQNTDKKFDKNGMQFPETEKLLNDQSVSDSPYSYLVKGFLSYFNHRVLCTEDNDFQRLFTTSKNILENEKLKDSFDFYFLALIHYFGLNGVKDENEGYYYFQEAKNHSFKLKFPDNEAFNILFTWFNSRDNIDIDAGFTSLFAIKKLILNQNERDFFNSNIVNFKAIIDMISINPNYCELDKNRSTEELYNQAISNYYGLLNKDRFIRLKSNRDHILSFTNFVEVVTEENEIYSYYIIPYKDIQNKELIKEEKSNSAYYLSLIYRNNKLVNKSCIASNFWFNYAKKWGSNL